MKIKFSIVLVIFFLIIALLSCDRGPKPVEISSLETYNDNITNFSIKYPSNWIKTVVPGARFVVFSHESVRNRFNKYDTKGFPGAKIDLVVTPIDSLITIDTVIAKSKIFGPEFYDEANITVDGVQGKKLVYSFELDGGMFNGIIIAATKDNKRATTLTIECFDNTYETYKSQIDEIISSLKLATASEKRIDTITQIVEAEPPSQNFDTREGDGFTIGIPDNFGLENIGKSASALKSWSFLGKRRGDSYIKIEMFDSKNKELKAIVDELKPTLPGAASPTKTTLDGKEAYFINYKPSGKVSGKTYFILHNKHLYRITLNWFNDEAKDYLPVFEKSVGSIKFK